MAQADTDDGIDLGRRVKNGRLRFNLEGVFFFMAGDGMRQVRRWQLAGRLAGGATY